MGDYDVESLPVLHTLHSQVPRAALIPHTLSQYLEGLRDGIRGHFPRRDSRARSEHDDRFQPPARIAVAIPATMNRIRANLATKTYTR